MKRRSWLMLVVVSIQVIALSACGADGDSSSGTTSAADGALSGSITVAAAASLTDAFTRIGDDFTADNPEVEVTFDFDSSSILATQIIDGAPADVFASADEANMAELADRNLITGEPVVFARNELVIVTKPGNPEGITGLADLADAGVVALCGEAVPCGKYAGEVLADAGVVIPEENVTRGQNVTATLTSVTEGDAVAGIVYTSDAVRAGDDVEAVTIPAEVNVIAVYPIGVIAGAESPDAAEAFVDYVVGPDGQEVLAEAGFLPPS